MPAFFFTRTAPAETYTLSLHDALPIYAFGNLATTPSSVRIGIAGPTTVTMVVAASGGLATIGGLLLQAGIYAISVDRKSTRLNSSHTVISYAVFCLKKKITSGICPWQT